MPNLFFIKTFIYVARTNSFRNAAHLNSITQSAVSQQIRTLERKLKCRLVERSGKSIRLTRSGSVFLQHAEKILDQYEKASQEVNADANTFSGTIRIGTIYSIGLYKLQPIIRTFLKKHPDVDIVLEYYHNDLIYDKTLNKTIDFGFVAYPKKKEGINIDFLTEDQMVLIQSAYRPAFKSKTVSLKDLGKQAMVSLAQSTPTGREMYRSFKKSNIPWNVTHEFENVETLKSAVIIGMGCALVPQNTLSQELQSKTLEIIKITDAVFKRPVGVLTSKGNVFNKAKEKFYNLILSQ